MSKDKDDKMAPPTWQPSDIKYEDWRFHVELWIKALDFCKGPVTLQGMGPVYEHFCSYADIRQG